MIEDLARNATEFCNELLTEVQTLKKENRWREVIASINEFKPNSFNYNTQTGIMNFGNASWQLKQIMTLDQTLQNEIIDKIKKRDVYIELRKKIADLRGMPETQVDFWLATLIRRIFSESVGKGSDLISVNPLLHTFLNDVIDGPMEWVITTYISGIVLNVERIQLEKEVSLRQPTVLDAEKLLGNTFPSFEFMPHFHTISAVLQIETTQKVQPVISPNASIYALLLLLYGKGSVNVIRTFWKGNSLIRTFGEVSVGPVQVWNPNEKYTLNKEDEAKLIRFAGRLKSKLPMDEKNGTLITDSHMGISLARYQDAILKNEDVINRISYAVMGLEALFLKSSEGGELSMRLSQRVGKLISAITEDNIFDIYNTVDNAYEIRSNFVHGSVQSKQTCDPKIILDKVLNYLRISIVVFLSVENKDKDQIINLIDHSILDHSVENKLLEMLSNYLEVVH